MRHTSAMEEAAFDYIDLRTIGAEHPTETLPALQFQHRFFLAKMQGVLLPPIALNGSEVLLDFPSGSGSWCIDVSQRYPGAQVWGVDTNQALLDLASEDALQHSSGHLHFRHTQNPCMFPFPDAAFNVIHLQQCTGLFSLRQRPYLFAEMRRLLKPGGWLHLVDFEMGFASGTAIDRLLTYFGQMLTALGRSDGTDGRLPVVGSVLGPNCMAQSGFSEIGYDLFPVNLGGWNNLVGRTYLAQCVIRPGMIISLAERTGIGTKEALQPLLREAQREMQSTRFCGVGTLLSSFGRKPLQCSTDR